MLINKPVIYLLFPFDKAPNKILDIVFGYSSHYIFAEQLKGLGHLSHSGDLLQLNIHDSSLLRKLNIKY